MSVVTPSTPSVPMANGSSVSRQVSRPPPPNVIPAHSILRPVNKQGIPIGPPVLNPTRSVSATIPNVPASGVDFTPIPTAENAAADGAKPAASVSVAPVPSSPTASNRTVSSTDSLGAPSHSTASTAQSSSPSASAASTLASSVSTSLDNCDAESNASSAGASTPRSSVNQSPKIRFGHCPERPPELRRRNSITLGVLARKNMLHAQGSIPAGSGGHNKVYMTDAEWEAYQQKFARKDTPPAVDLGAVVSSGAKNFWRKVRRGSNASVTSNASTSSSTGATNGRGRSDSSTSQTGAVSPRIGPVDVDAPIEEEEEPHSAPGSPRGGALQLSSIDGDATPGRRRSPSPPAHHRRSLSPPPANGSTNDSAVYDDEDDSYSNAATSPVLSNGNAAMQQHPTHEHPDHVNDDADAEYESHKMSSTAALGFDMRDYSKRATWGRRGSGSSSPAPANTQPAQPVPQSHPRLI